MWQSRLRRVLCLTLLAGVGIATTASVATADLSKREYRRQATAICARTARQFSSLEVPPPTSRARLAQGVRAMLPLYHAEIAAWRKLDPPIEYRALHMRFIADETKQLQNTELFLNVLSDILEDDIPVLIRQWNAWDRAPAADEQAALRRMHIPGCM